MARGLTMTEDPSWNGETRRIGPELLRDHLADDLRSYAYLVAGRPPKVNAIVETLHDAGIPEERVLRRSVQRLLTETMSHRGMEPLWSPVVATGGNQWQIV